MREMLLGKAEFLKAGFDTFLFSAEYFGKVIYSFAGFKEKFKLFLVLLSPFFSGVGIQVLSRFGIFLTLFSL